MALASVKMKVDYDWQDPVVAKDIRGGNLPHRK